MKMVSRAVLYLLCVWILVGSISAIPLIQGKPDFGTDCRSCHIGHSKINGVYPMTTNKNGTTVEPGATFTITITLSLSNSPWNQSDAYIHFQPGKGNNDDFTFVPNTEVQDNTVGLDSNPTVGDMSVTFTVTAPTAEGWYDAKAYSFLKGQGSEEGEGVGPLHGDVHTWINVKPSKSFQDIASDIDALTSNVNTLEGTVSTLSGTVNNLSIAAIAIGIIAIAISVLAIWKR